MKQKPELIDSKSLEKIVAESVKHTLLKKGIQAEAYVSEPTPFKQMTDNVSQRTKDGHTELYLGYSANVNKIAARLDSVPRDDANSAYSEYRSLKMDETYNLNAKYLHELYFSNCFNATSDIHMNSHAYIRLSRDFGDFDRWQKDFMSCALSSGEGWAVTGYHLLLKKYVNTFISHHSSDVLLGLYPVVVVDMWSHAYHKDYIVDKKSYLVAMMREFNWATIEKRFEVAEKIAGVLK